MDERASPPAALADDADRWLDRLIQSEGGEFNVFPLLFSQQQIWLLDQLHPGSSLYNLPAAVRMRGALDLPALQRSLSAIIGRHEALRTTFTTVAGQPVQVIAPALRAPLTVRDLRALPDPARAAERLAQAHARAAFDLRRGPLIRIALLRMGPAEHILLLTLHHIVADGWSIAVFVRELAALYGAYASGLPPALPDLPIQYADYAVWKRAQMQGSELDDLLAYWRAQLADAPAVLDLPADHPRPARPTFRGARLPFALAPELAATLARLSQAHAATLFMTLLAAFQALLARYADQPRIATGSPIANRTHSQTEDLIGCFVNTLVLYVDLAGDPSFAELLGRVRAVCLDAYAHQDLPFELLVEALRPERSLSHMPLFQVMFALQNTPALDLSLVGLALHMDEVESGTAKFDLLLSMEERPEGLGGWLEYSVDLFEGATIARLARHFQTLLAGVVADPARRLSALPLLSAPERQQMLIEWNARDGAGGFVDVARRVAGQVARFPDAVAGVCEGAHLSYAALVRRADQLAYALIARGVGPDALVALLLDRTLDVLVGILGVLRAGGAYVPIDPAYPPERIRFMLEDSRAHAVVTNDQGRRTKDEGSDSSFIDLWADWPAIARQPARRLRDAHPAQLAYMIYTSGSTGRPKGALVTRGGLGALCAGVARFFDDDAVEASGLITSISFDISVNQIFPTLLAGRTLQIIPDEVKYDGSAVLRYVAARRIQTLDGVPSYFHMALAAGGPVRTALRYLLIGGEPLTRALLDALFAQLGPDLAVVNIYGLTESSDINAHTTLRARDLVGPITVGRPMPRNQLYIIDRHLRPQPIGVVGELCVAGASVGRGYHSRPELTAERFAPNSFAPATGDVETQHVASLPQPHMRLFRTGDLARYRADGRVEILGRRDAQIKLRGYRIELGEVAAALAQDPGVRECTVVVREDAAGAPQIVAYVVTSDEFRVTSSSEPPAARRPPTTDEGSAIGDALHSSFVLRPSSFDPDSSLDLDSSLVTRHVSRAAELRRFLAARLPAYMLPAAFVDLDALPRTPNGKLDRKALPDPEWPGARAVEAGARTALEGLLARIWCDVLGVAQVDPQANFFALGGHSLLAMRVISRLRSALGVELPLRALFEAPTVAELAARVEEAQRAVHAQGLPPLRPAPRTGALPLSFAQQRLWFLDQLAPGGAVYNIPTAIHLSGALDPAALRRSFGDIVARHEALRTVFMEVDSQAAQLILPPWPFRLALADLRALEPDARAAALERLARDEARRPFDLARGPLIRAALVRVADAEHALLLTIHHIVADGWSVGVLVRELAAFYQARTAGRAADLPDLPVQYADFALWQRAWLRGASVDALLAYWRRQLAGAPALDLPTDRPRPPAQTFSGAIHSFALPADLAEALDALSRREGSTLFMALLASFDVVLARYSGQDDIAIGSPIANRVVPEVEPLIGFFVNTLVLRADLRGDPSMREALARVRATALAAYAHQDLPFEQLVEDLQPTRDLSRTPLFQVMFVLQNAPLPALDLPDAGVRVHARQVSSGTARFDLLLSVEERDGGLAAWFEYNSDLFDATTIARLAGHWRQALAQLAADPSRRLSALALLSAAERQQALAEWNDTAGVNGQGSEVRGQHTGFGAGLAELVAQQAARTPDAVALTFADSYLSYRELDRRANQLAHHLRARGVGPDVAVGLRLPRSLDLAIGALGVIKAGGAVVPLDPSYPSERLAFMLDDSQARVLVTKDEPGGLAGAPASHPASIVDLGDNRAEIGRQPDDPPAHAAGADNLAYIIYTSGSTGRPKGVAMTQGALINLLRWQMRSCAIPGPATTLQFAPLSFDVSFQELFLTWCTGGTLALIDEDLRRDPAALLGALAARAVERLFVPFVALQQLAEATQHAPAPGLRLREILTAGEQLQPTPALAAWLRALPGCTLENQYGPSESHVITAYRMPPDPAGWPALPPIGRPIASSLAYVLDRAGQPAPIGVAGELYLGGAQLARGYHRRPNLTAARFIPNPFGQGSGIRGWGSDPEPRSLIPDPRLYRTGDRARYRPDGLIEYLGRVDEQVKVRGYRIEPAEIAAMLERHPSVQRCVVVVRAEASGDRRLVAYIVQGSGIGDQGSGTTARDDLNPDPRSLIPDLRAFLAERLPAYMIPSAFVTLDALPLTPSGKVARRALPEPSTLRPELDEGYVAPRTPLEALIAGCWAEALGRASVGVHDNFFALGGHSLLATRAVARVREALGQDLPLRALFENPTVAGLAAWIEQGRRAAQRPTPPLTRQARGGRGPLSFAQQRFWFLQQLAPASPAYVMSMALRLSGRLDWAALAHSLAALVARHETLRTAFATEDGRPIQLIASSLRLRPPLLDLSGLGARAAEAQLQRLASDDAHTPFDLARAPLIRAALLRMAAQEHALLISLHHIIADAWSMDVLVRELTALYQARVAGRPDPLPDLPVQYLDYAIWQREWLRGAALDEQLAYWRRHLAGADGQGGPPRLDLPTDHPRPAIPAFRGASQALRLPRALAGALARLNQRMGATLFMTLLAAFAITLRRYSGQRDLVIGSPIANRTRSDIEGLIGLFLNTLALRCDLSGDPRFVDLLARVRETTLDAYTHQDLPFEKLVEALQPERDLSRAPIVQVVLNLLNTAPLSIALPGLTVRAIEVDNGTSKFDLTLFAHESAQGLALSMQYNSDLFEAATVARMLRHFRTVLESVAADPGRRIDGLPLLTAGERQQALIEWNDTIAPYPAGRTIQALFAEQVARAPDVTAAAMAGPPADAPPGHGLPQITYGALDRRANQLARHLRALGVGLESRVGLFMERSVDLAVAMLGALKAGSAYVPIDPSYPPERIRFMLDDSQATAIVTKDEGRRTIAGGGRQEAGGRSRGLEADGAGADDFAHEQSAARDARRAANDEARSFVVRRSSFVDLAADWPAIARLPATAPADCAGADSLAYVIYTSGSTGRPKGVAVSHTGVGNLALAQARFYELGPGARVFQLVSFSFDGAVSDFVMALLSGATLCLAPQAAAQLGTGVIDLLRDHAITTIKLPPSLLAALPADPLPALRTVITAGEPCPADLVARWGSGRRFFNIYGPSEVTVCATAARCEGDAERPPIGRPLPNKRVYLLDARMQPVPIGAPGEICVGGVGLARGYLGRPDLTAERFVPNPFAQGSGVWGLGAAPEPRTLNPEPRLYRTGDLARFRPDGSLEFLGRVDQQVKLRGYRIELDEIAAVLDRHPAVRRSVAALREDAPGDRRLVAYVVPRQGSGVGEQGSAGSEPGNLIPDPRSLIPELRAFLAQSLPAYMIPSAFVELDALPLTPNGKADRAALPAPGSARPDLPQSFAAPQTPVEDLLAGIWSQTLGIERVGVHDNFFELGGDSILSLQIVARANAAGLRITPKQLFQRQTVAELALAVDTLPAAHAEQGLVTGDLPLTPIQRRFFEQDLPEPWHWNQSLLLELRHPTRPDRLRRAVGHLLAHHDALRLRFARDAGGWRQTNAAPGADIPFVRADLSRIPEGRRGRALEDAAAQIQASLDLARGPIVRVALFDMGARRTGRLLFVAHHLAVDGVSWRVLLEDLQAAYDQISHDEPVRLPHKTTSFRRWAERLAQHARSDDLRAERDHWLAELPALAELPLDDPDGCAANTEDSIEIVSVALDADDTGALLHEAPQAYHTQINDLLLTALAQCVEREVGPGALLIDLEGQGREDLFDDVDLSRTVGWFTTVFPALLEIDPYDHAGEQIKAVKEQLRAIPQHGIGYGLLRYLSGDVDLADALRARPQAEIGFNYLGQFDQTLAESALMGPAHESSGPARSGRAQRAHLLYINSMIVEGRLRLDWMYSRRIHRRERIERLAESFVEALRALIAHCLAPDAGGYTPSDFSDFQWSQTDLDAITRSIGKITGEA